MHTIQERHAILSVQAIDSEKPVRTDEEYLELLRSIDDPFTWEIPKTYSYTETRDGFVRFAYDLEENLGTPCQIETDSMIQDASFVGQVILPAQHLHTQLPNNELAVVRISNFGALAAVSNEKNILQSTRDILFETLHKHGYTYIPSHILNLPYHQVERDAIGIWTWWIRFFDWL